MTAAASWVRFRRGWMLGDGTGCGKGRQVAAIILDNRLRGRKRALWLSQSDKLLEDARRDWCALGGLESDVIPLGNFRQGMEIPLDESILFATYATLRSPTGRESPRGSTRSSNGWPARSTRTTATPSTARSCSTRPTPWRTPPARSPNAARSSRPSRAVPG